MIGKKESMKRNTSKVKRRKRRRRRRRSNTVVLPRIRQAWWGEGVGGYGFREDQDPCLKRNLKLII